jgi:hypothetical protein
MKFNDLYNRVFVTEQPEEIANPEQFKDDVEGLPVPEPSLDAEEGTESTGRASNLSSYLQSITQMEKDLVSVEGPCLQKLIHQLDKPGTPFEDTKKQISNLAITAAKALSDLRASLAGVVNGAGGNA